ncbi:Unconventional myosin-Va [Halotydeus destructor]|nr:Unconventional myosin-Va [Halotydeus destructor]
MSTVIPVLYTKGSKVWVQDKETIWKYAIVKLDFVENDKQLITEDAENGSEIIVQIESVDKLPPLRNPDILIGANDLTSLSYLHEPAVLYNLRVRFLDKSAIYTWCGIVLVAVNPFSDLDIYGDETIQTYHRSSMGNTQLDPHIYAVAEDAFSKLERESRNQSIIVSGESGAGKTVSAKFAMRYFASIAGSNATSNVENRVLASNPIMEAIGNAKTTRNDNSSRFGKYIQIIFDPQSRAIVGGNMRTYLLEKSRISRQSEGERNFHIFYQMCSYAKSANLSHLGLDSWDFDYLGTQKPGNHDDIAKFNEAMHILAFTEKQQNVIYRIVAAVLHAGNIGFVRVDEEQCAIPQEDFHLTCFCELLGLDESATRTWLTQRVLRTGMKEVIVTPVVQDIAEQGRDALAKFIYEKMFAWVVSLINRALGSSSDASTFIGVLDIYGFEHFEVNSFEQFCINYANEVLQQQFNQHVFKLEQEEYVREGIDWQFITFTDNQPVIDVIEAKLGILSLLDEECRMPRGSDESWCTKLYSQIKVGEFFQQPKIGSRNSFIIQHFADKVVYTVDGFLEKNRDTVWEEQIDLLKRSTMLDSVFADEQSVDSAPQKPGGKMRITPQQQNKQTKQAKATVGSQFRDSLAALMRTLNATTPHYVRCIKSNDDKAPFDFDNVRAVQQLRACGVLETIRISSNGFPSRWTYQDFANRYRVLLVGVSQVIKKQGAASGGPPVPVPRKLVRAGSSSTSELKAVCEQIVRIVYELQVYSKFKLPVEQEQQEKSTEHLYQFGKTKIFFRAGQVALLERIRTQRLKECAILLQRMVRGWLQRKRYVKVKLAVTKLQTYARGYLARRKYWHLKCTKAATVIQTRWRGYRARKKYLELRKCAVGIQKFARGLLARRLFQSLREKRAATTIQRYWRGYMARSDYRKKLRQIVIVQSVTRRHFAQKVLKKLRIEAKSVAHVTQLNKGLERKIFELQNKIDDLNQDLTKAKSSKADLSKEKAETQKLDTAVKNMKNALSDKEKELEKLQSQLDSRDQSYGSLEKKLSESLTVIEKLKEVNKSMENRYDSKAVEEAVAQKEKTLNAKFERERKIQMEERESEKHAYQQLLRKYAALEERLQGEQNGFDGDRSPDVTTVSMMMRLSEMEQECAKLKHENQQMRELMANTTNSTDNDGAASLLAQQCAAMQQELDRAREEKTHLKTIVLGQEGSMGSKEPSGDSEVISAFKAYRQAVGA